MDTLCLLPRRKLYCATSMGADYLVDAISLLKEVKDKTIDLILTSPPFPLAQQKGYGLKLGLKPNRYAEWFIPLAKEMYRVLRPEESPTKVIDPPSLTKSLDSGDGCRKIRAELREGCICVEPALKELGKITSWKGSEIGSLRANDHMS